MIFLLSIKSNNASFGHRWSLLTAAIAVFLTCVCQMGAGTRADDSNPNQTGEDRSAPTVVFYRVSQVPTNENPVYDVRFEYSFPKGKSIYLDHVGNVPAQGFQAFLTSDPYIRFRTSEVGPVVASWSCKKVIEAKQRELTEASARPGSWLTQAQILNSLGKPAAAKIELQRVRPASFHAAGTQSQALAEFATASLQQRDYGLAEQVYSRAAKLTPEPVKASTFALAAGFAAYRAGDSPSATQYLGELSASPALPSELEKQINSLRAITNSALKSAIGLDSPENPINKYLGDVEVAEAFDTNSTTPDVRSSSWSSAKPFDELVQQLALRLFDDYPLDVTTPCVPHLCYVSKFRRFKDFSTSGNIGSMAIMISRWFPRSDGHSVVYKLQYTVMQRSAGSSASWTRASDNEVLLKAGKVITAISDQIAGLQK